MSKSLSDIHGACEVVDSDLNRELNILAAFNRNKVFYHDHYAVLSIKFSDIDDKRFPAICKLFHEYVSNIPYSDTG